MPGSGPPLPLKAQSTGGSGAHRLPVGRFRYDVPSADWWWSDEMFGIYGFEPGDVRPSTQLLSAHVHPEDRADWASFMEQAVTDGQPFSFWHRIIDARRRVRSVVCTGHSGRDGDGRVILTQGYLVDLTENLRGRLADEVTDAIRRSAESRAGIEQAKGALMMTFDISGDDAFSLLRWHSAHANIKLRDVARHLMEQLNAADRMDLPPRQRTTAILNAMASQRSSPVTGPNLPPRPSDRPSRARLETEPATTIATEDLPRTLMRAVASAAQSITIADCQVEDLPLVYMNQAFLELTGYAPADALGRNCRFLQGPDTDLAEVAAMKRSLEQGREVSAVLRNYRRDGTGFWNEIQLSPVYSKSGKLTHYIGYQIDVSERVDRERQLYQMAYYDPATGLPNEALGRRALDAAIGTAGPDGLTVIWVEIKSSSASDGGGNTLIEALAARLRSVLPELIGLARIEKDALLLTTSGAAGDMAARTVLRLSNEPLPTPEGLVHIEMATGIFGSPSKTLSAAEMIRLAQAAALR